MCFWDVWNVKAERTDVVLTQSSVVVPPRPVRRILLSRRLAHDGAVREASPCMATSAAVSDHAREARRSRQHCCGDSCVCHSPSNSCRRPPRAATTTAREGARWRTSPLAVWAGDLTRKTTYDSTTPRIALRAGYERAAPEPERQREQCTWWSRRTRRRRGGGAGLPALLLTRRGCIAGSRARSGATSWAVSGESVGKSLPVTRAEQAVRPLGRRRRTGAAKEARVS